MIKKGDTMTKSRLKLETKRKLYLFALAVASAATLGKAHKMTSTSNPKNAIEKKVEEKDNIAFTLEEMYEEKIEFPETFPQEELLIVTRFPEMDPNQSRDYFFISKKNYVEYKSQGPGFSATYKKYPQITNQENYVTDYQIWAYNNDFTMIPCAINLSKEINWLPSNNICFRHGVFELKDILSSEMMKEEYTENDLKEIEKRINDVTYDYSSNQENTYLLNELALLESSKNLHIVEKNNYILTAEPLESLNEFQAGAIYYRKATNNQSVGEPMTWNTKNQELTFYRTDYMKEDKSKEEPETFYTEDIYSYLPEEYKQNIYTKSDLIQVENYFNEHKYELFYEKGKER